MFIVTGLLTALLAAIGYLIRSIRNLETELPDYVAD